MLDILAVRQGGQGRGRVGRCRAGRGGGEQAWLTPCAMSRRCRFCRYTTTSTLCLPSFAPLCPASPLQFTSQAEAACLLVKRRAQAPE